MTQTVLALPSRLTRSIHQPVSAGVVGLLCDDEVVTLRFMETLEWGRPVRQVRLGRDLAEQLRRLLNDELEDAAWS